LRRGLVWLLSLVVGIAALVGLIAIFNSRDSSSLSKQSAATGAPGKAYTGEPVLSPADADAVRLGNVVVLYRDAKPPAGTSGLVPPGGRALEQAGQSVVLDREPTLKTPLAAVSAKRIQPGATPAELQAFIDYWLGGHR
jgi:hypothetical protein